MTIQSAMLLALGFLVASLFAILFAPAFWSRAVRLTTQRIKSSLPLTETEIRADRDQLRAQYAVRVHQLEKANDEAKLAAARQLVELNRRDVSISDLGRNVDTLQLDLEENQNARRVLEQTINNRLPQVETRLDDARLLLSARDREIAELSTVTRRQSMAIDEAQTVNKQQSAEIERMKLALTARQARDRRRFVDHGLESEAALRNEIEVLRTTSREQTSLIDRMQANIAVSDPKARTSYKATDSRNGSASTSGTNSGNRIANAGLDLLRKKNTDQSDEIAQLRRRLAASELDLSKRGDGESAEIEAALNREVASLNALTQERANDIERLQTELKALQGKPDEIHADLPESKTALKARLEGIEQRLVRESESSARLRTELTASNERAARQASHYMEEMRRFGVAAPTATISTPTIAAGTDLDIEPPSNGAEDNGQRSLTQRVADAIQKIDKREEKPSKSASAANSKKANNGDQPEKAPSSADSPKRNVAVSSGRRSARLLDRLRSYDDG